MDPLPVIHDWYWKMLLESGFTEAWLDKGDSGQARVSAERFLEVTRQTSEHTWQARAWYCFRTIRAHGRQEGGGRASSTQLRNDYETGEFHADRRAASRHFSFRARDPQDTC
jgi:hypothetical protein